MESSMKIGELAGAAECQVETVRYYERESAACAEPLCRQLQLYGAAHLERLTFIRHCRSLDMSLAEVRRLLHFKDAPDENCGEVNALLDTHITKIGQRMVEQQTLQQQMTELRSFCSQERASKDCGILQGLAATHTSKNEESNGRPLVLAIPASRPI